MLYTTQLSGCWILTSDHPHLFTRSLSSKVREGSRERGAEKGGGKRKREKEIKKPLRIVPVSAGHMPTTN
jgi:hypothetical protein